MVPSRYTVATQEKKGLWAHFPVGTFLRVLRWMLAVSLRSGTEAR